MGCLFFLRYFTFFIKNLFCPSVAIFMVSLRHSLTHITNMVLSYILNKLFINLYLWQQYVSLFGHSIAPMALYPHTYIYKSYTYIHIYFTLSREYHYCILISTFCFKIHACMLFYSCHCVRNNQKKISDVQSVFEYDYHNPKSQTYVRVSLFVQNFQVFFYFLQ